MPTLVSNAVKRDELKKAKEKSKRSAKPKVKSQKIAGKIVTHHPHRRSHSRLEGLVDDETAQVEAKRFLEFSPVSSPSKRALGWKLPRGLRRSRSTSRSASRRFLNAMSTAADSDEADLQPDDAR